MTVQDAATVTGIAPATTTGIEVAVGSTPDSGHFGASGHVEGPALAAVQAAATTGRGSCPDGVRTLVGDLEGGCMDGGDEAEEEDKEDAQVAHTGKLGADNRSIDVRCGVFWLVPHQ